MELLTIKHQDFYLIIECSKFDDVWNKAVKNITEEDALLSYYSWSDGVESINLQHPQNTKELRNRQKAPAIFFDNTDYPIWVEFKDYVKDASFGSELQSENNRFSFRHHILAGFLNYNNEIGRSEINLIYNIDGNTKLFTFGFEVLSQKLDYHSQWKAIIEDIEDEYRMLSLDYMRRTFHGFNPDNNGKKSPLIWWSVFGSLQQEFIRACKNIIERPHHRLQGHSTYKRADCLTFIPTSIENELAEHRSEPARMYRVEESIQTNDTPENRFLKFAIKQLADKYEYLKKRIEKIDNISNTKRDEMDKISDSLRHLQHNPFFRTVGHFKGLNQESIVLQKATSYSKVYRTWNLLRRSYSLNDGMYRLQTKDIATLYEIWCFIEVGHIVKEQLHLEDSDVEQKNRMEINGLFTWELGKGEHSRIIFKKDNVELAQLVYNPKNTTKENSPIGIKNLIVPTVPQKPDIVLQLTKNDLTNNMKFTYLFDAKYRIDGKEGNVDVPPDDTLNQMHRYRDAIYYKDHKDASLKKEIIGGYILFPGDGEPADVQASKFYKTIEKVNVGAFPLRPKDKHNRKLLEEFIRDLIEKNSTDIISKVIPQKGTFVEVGNRVLIGLVKESTRHGYLQSFKDGNATLYYTGLKFPTTISLQDLHFFIPYIKDKGIRDVYEIVRVRTITGSEAKQSDKCMPDDLRLAFELKFSRKLYVDYKMINTHRMIQYTFSDTTFDKLEDLMY